MKRRRFPLEQIVGVSKQAEGGVPVAELIRQVGISEQTFYLEEAVYGSGSRPSAPTEAVAGRGRSAEAGGGGPDVQAKAWPGLALFFFFFLFGPALQNLYIQAVPWMEQVL